MFTCNLCNYLTDRKDNFDRHITSKKHKKKFEQTRLQEQTKLQEDDKQREEELQQLEKQQKQIQDRILCLQQGGSINENQHIEQDNTQEEEIDVLNETRNQTVHFCEKCAATYKTLKYFENHVKKCNGVDSLTCPTCMKTFTDYSNKCKHIKRATCKPATIYKQMEKKYQIDTPSISNDNGNISNSTVNSHNTYHTHNTNNTNNKYNITNIYINNYGQERTDYMTYDLFYSTVEGKVLKTISEYFKIKHFHEQFPENNNIRHKNNRFFIKQNGKWEIIDKGILMDMIFNACGSELEEKIVTYEDRIKSEKGMKDNTDDKYDTMVDSSNRAKLELDGKKYNKVKKFIVDVIENASKKYSPEYVQNTNGYYDQTT